METSSNCKVRKLWSTQSDKYTKTEGQNSKLQGQYISVHLCVCAIDACTQQRNDTESSGENPAIRSPRRILGPHPTVSHRRRQEI